MVLALLFCVIPSFAQDIGITLLVNFVADENGQDNAVSASNFRDVDPDVFENAPVNRISAGMESEVLLAEGLSGVTINVARKSNLDWNTSKGHFKSTPILDSYLYSDSEANSLSYNVSVSGFDEIPVGQKVTITMWGVGDTSNSDSEFAITYNGEQSEVKSTDFDAGIIEEATVSFTFEKVLNVNELTINWGPYSDETSGFSGFSMTTSHYVAIPEFRSYVFILSLIAFVVTQVRRLRP